MPSAENLVDPRHGKPALAKPQKALRDKLLPKLKAMRGEYPQVCSVGVLIVHSLPGVDPAEARAIAEKELELERKLPTDREKGFLGVSVYGPEWKNEQDRHHRQRWVFCENPRYRKRCVELFRRGGDLLGQGTWPLGYRIDPFSRDQKGANAWLDATVEFARYDVDYENYPNHPSPVDDNLPPDSADSDESAGTYPKKVLWLHLRDCISYAARFAEAVVHVPMLRPPPPLNHEAARLAACLGAVADAVAQRAGGDMYNLLQYLLQQEGGEAGELVRFHRRLQEHVDAEIAQVTTGRLGRALQRLVEQEGLWSIEHMSQRTSPRLDEMASILYDTADQLACWGRMYGRSGVTTSHTFWTEGRNDIPETSASDADPRVAGAADQEEEMVVPARERAALAKHASHVRQFRRQHRATLHECIRAMRCPSDMVTLEHKVSNRLHGEDVPTPLFSVHHVLSESAPTSPLRCLIDAETSGEERLGILTRLHHQLRNQLKMLSRFAPSIATASPSISTGKASPTPDPEQALDDLSRWCAKAVAPVAEKAEASVVVEPEAGISDQSRLSKKLPIEPTQQDREAVALVVLRGMKQSEVAKLIFGNEKEQYRVSRAKKRVEAYATAMGLPGTEAWLAMKTSEASGVRGKTLTVDPTKLDLGKRERSRRGKSFGFGYARHKPLSWAGMHAVCKGAYA